MTQAGSGRAAPDDPGVAERSGRDAVEAVERAARGTPHGGVATPVEDAAPHTAPVEQVRDDAAMTHGQVVGEPGAVGDDAPATGPDPARSGSGGAQSVVGARVSDRVAAGEPAPGDPAAGAERPS